MATINLGHVKGDKGDTGATGPAGATGATGAQGPAGPAGPGCPTGGTAGQMLTKASGTDYDYNWSDINLCTMRKVPFTIAANDWTLSNGVYTATFTTAYVTSSSIETVYYDESIDSYMKAYIVADKKSGGGGVVFSTKKVPTGIITGQIHVMDNDDGKVPVIIEGTVTPVANGGTQESTVAGVQNRFGIVNIDSISDAYSSSATYAVGDMCIYNNTLYKCSTAISTAEEWNSAHWTETTISDELDSLGEQMANLNKSSHLSGSSTYLTSYDIYYTKLGNVCTFVCQFTPNTNISSSIGTVDNIGLPKPKHNYVCIYPAVEAKEGWTVADVQGRYGSLRGASSLSSAQMKASGSFSAGVTYMFAGSYVTEN